MFVMTLRSISDAQVDDLVAYLRAVAAADLPEDPVVRTGYGVGEQLGCFRCHGPGGRGAVRNPGSLKGYIPPWDGRDFTELVADEAELREWILEGASATAPGEPVGSVLPRSPSDSDARIPRPD